MKTMITGSFTLGDPDVVSQAIKDTGWDITTVITGSNPGAEAHAYKWATKQHKQVKVITQTASHGGAARLHQLEDMLKLADSLIVLWAGHDRDLGRVLSSAKGLKLPVHEVRV